MSGKKYKWLGFKTEGNGKVLIKYDDIVGIEDTFCDFVCLHLSNGETVRVSETFNEIYESIARGSGSWY